MVEEKAWKGRQDYQGFMKELLDKGYARKVPPSWLNLVRAAPSVYPSMEYTIRTNLAKAE